MSIVSTLLKNAQRILYLDDLPAVGDKRDEFTVVSVINQSYGLYGYATALAALSAQGHLIIMFAGTDDLSDVIADIGSAVQESWPEVDGKARFVNGLLDVFKAIFVPWLATVPIQRAKSMTLTGHSAGATFAMLAGIWLSIVPKPRLTIKPVIYAYAAPIFGNQAAKQLMERLKLEIYDLVTTDDPVPALSLPGFVRVGNGPTAPQRNFVLSGLVDEAKLVTAANSNIPWILNPLKVSRHSLISTYIPMLKNILAGQNGGVKCTYNAAAVRQDPLKTCSPSARCIEDGGLVPCGPRGWCGSNGLCVAKQVPYKCSAATDCVVGAEMCITPGYHLPSSSWDAISEPCKPGATCSRNPWDLTRYCWNK